MTKHQNLWGVTRRTGTEQPLRHQITGERPHTAIAQAPDQPADTYGMVDPDALLAELGPPAAGPAPYRSPDGDNSALHAGLTLLHSPRTCEWRTAVLDPSSRLLLPVARWAGTEVAIGGRAASVSIADWRWFAQRPGVFADEALPLRVDSRGRATLPWPALAHIDARPGDPLVIGVQDAASLPVIHLIGPATYERAAGLS